MPKIITTESKNRVLQPYIEGYTYFDLNNTSIQSKDFIPKTGMVWGITSTPIISDTNSTYDNFLIGIQNKPLPLQWEPQGTGFFVKFSPYGMSRFLDIPLQRFSNIIVESRKIWGSDIEFIHERIINCETIAGKISTIESFLINRLKKPTRSETEIFQLADTLKNEEHSITVLKNKFPLSSRQLERKFKNLIGVNIQTFNKICRFQRALNLLSLNNINLTDIGYEVGYYDQAHFSNNFKDLAKFRPKKFFKEAPFYKLLDKATSV